MHAEEPHPQVRALLDRMDSLDFPDVSTLSVEGARRLFEKIGSSNRYRGGDVATTDREVDSDAGEIPIRVYRPREGDGTVTGETLPTTVYFHGGGFVVGSLDTHDALCRAIADLWQTGVVSAD